MYFIHTQTQIHEHTMNEFTNDSMEPVRKDMLTKGLEQQQFENSEQWKLKHNDRMIDAVVWWKNLKKVREHEQTKSFVTKKNINSVTEHEWWKWHELGKYRFYWYSRRDLITCTLNEWHVYFLTASTFSNYRTNRKQAHTRNTLK